MGGCVSVYDTWKSKRSLEEIHKNLSAIDDVELESIKMSERKLKEYRDKADEIELRITDDGDGDDEHEYEDEKDVEKDKEEFKNTMKFVYLWEDDIERRKKMMHSNALRRDREILRHRTRLSRIAAGGLGKAYKRVPKERPVTRFKDKDGNLQEEDAAESVAAGDDDRNEYLAETDAAAAQTAEAVDDAVKQSEYAERAEAELIRIMAPDAPTGAITKNAVSKAPVAIVMR
jgi:hypothetical protein